MHREHIIENPAPRFDSGYLDITTDRLRLQALSRKHRDAAVLLLADKDIAWNLARVPAPYAAADFDAFLKQIQDDDKDDVVLAITNWQDGAFLGAVSLMATHCDEDEDLVAEAGASSKTLELGYWLGKPYWGHGIVKEAATALLDHYFAVSDCDTIRAGYFIDNPRSGQILQFLGFRDIGERQVYSLARGVEVDHRDMELTREAYMGADQKPGEGRQRDLARSTSYSMNY